MYVRDKSRTYTGQKHSVAFAPIALLSFPFNSGLRPETHKRQVRGAAADLVVPRRTAATWPVQSVLS